MDGVSRNAGRRNEGEAVEILRKDALGGSADDSDKDNDNFQSAE